MEKFKGISDFNKDKIIKKDDKSKDKKKEDKEKKMGGR